MYPKTKKMIQQLIEDEVIPGANFGFITTNERLEYHAGSAAILPKREAIKENQVYDVASLTKVFLTATIFLQLWQEGKLAPDDKVSRYLTDFTDQKVTLRHLLTHTSGIEGYIPNRNTLSASELREAILHLPVGKLFEKEVRYTDIGFILLGFIIEVIEKDSLDNVFAGRISGPLNLTDSSYHPRDKQACAPTEMDPKRGMIRGDVHDPKAYILGNHCGSAGLFSTLTDCLTFSQMILNRGELNRKRILNEKTVLLLLKDWTPNGKLNRSLGWDIKTKGSKNYLFHTGFTGTFIILDILQKTAFVFLSNRVHPTNDNKSDYLNQRDRLVDCYLAEKETMKNQIDFRRSKSDE
ncbi:CubicO group peptidase, beta-lactamase class C family [Carnobacterium alterfunditum]|uniref:CubicO group peptidase, beta-lactamase class C family n=1 Tax=Carnobacterium alterfunditum TaxID=28230 RepID=A0A1N6HT10_9LACT|nr:serine hydrolase domain-containing protein [Carnobacterium alterfunditum]SIO22789.1 CubicO group peptidase, beta-lactamase class C family [Carnobacterium alterfunditum]